MIYQTIDYSIFQRMEGNRPINQLHVKRLAKSMNERGFIPAYHIVVNEGMILVDGQHRLEAAKSLGVPVFYVIQPDIDIHINRDLNSTSKGWSVNDYLDSFVEQGLTDYIAMKEFSQRYPMLSVSSITHLSEMTGGYLINNFKAGNTKFNPDSAFVVTCAEVITLLANEGYPATRTMTLAVKQLVALDGFNFDIFKQRLTRYPFRVRKGADVNSWLATLVKLYNHTTRKDNCLSVVTIGR